jgi:hypothetical protein
VLPLTQSYDTLEGKKLCFASSNTCAFPGCRQTMYDFEQKVKICDILHNKTVQKGGMRYNEIKLPQANNNIISESKRNYDVSKSFGLISQFSIIDCEQSGRPHYLTPEHLTIR